MVVGDFTFLDEEIFYEFSTSNADGYNFDLNEHPLLDLNEPPPDEFPYIESKIIIYFLSNL